MISTKKAPVLLTVLLIIASVLLYMVYNNYNSSQSSSSNESYEEMDPRGEIIRLPEPNLKGSVTVEEALYQRRSVREYMDKSLSLHEISQLLWSAQGITEPATNGRTAPSAGATYPIEVYLLVRSIDNLKPGVYYYKPEGHSIMLCKEGYFSKTFRKPALTRALLAKVPPLSY